MSLDAILLLILTLKISGLRCVKMKMDSDVDSLRRENERAKVVLEVFQSCLAKKYQNVVINSRDEIDVDLFMESSFLCRIPTQLLDYERLHKDIVFEQNEEIETPYSRVRRRYLSTSFAIPVSDDAMLAKILKSIRDSIWFDDDTFFLIVEEGANSSCRQLAHAHLRAAWKFNISTVIYLCEDLKNQLLLYTFNPYAKDAPAFWKYAQSDDSDDDTWSLLVHKVEKPIGVVSTDSSLCDELYFDKTKNLNGYHLRAALTLNSLYYYNATDANKCRNSGLSIRIICLALQHLNATITVKQSTTTGSLDDSGEPQGPLRDVLKGNVDVLMNLYAIKPYWRYQFYPYSQTTLNIFSVANTLNYGARFLVIFNPRVWLNLLSVCLLLIVTLKYALKLSFSESILEFLRVLVSTSTVRKPQQSSRRLNLITAIVIGFMINSNIQSRLSAINTVPDSSYINSVEDLLASNIPIYGTSNHKQMINIEEIKRRYIVIGDFPECGELLVKNEPVACINQRYWISVYLPKNEKIYASRQQLSELPVTHTFKKDSPLRDKVGRLALHLTESGFFKVPLSKFSELEIWRKNHRKDRDNYVENKLICRFVLAGGWISSIFICSIEVLILRLSKGKKRKVTFKLQIRKI